jgi:hypothetical protein
MQIASTNLALLSPPNGSLLETEKRGKAAQSLPDERIAPQGNSPAPVALKSDAVEKVSISQDVRAQDAGNTPVPVYAEIWKGSIKVAQVDIHGHVVSFSGLVASGGGGTAGQILAAQRAIQVAQQIGGEIRTAGGQTLDSQTLMMRSRLASAYGV